MVRNVIYLLLGTIVLAGCGVSVQMTDCDLSGEPKQALRHVVLFKFKDGTAGQQIRDIENAFCALPGKINTICDFEWGTDVSVENLQQGFTHCFVLTFRNEAGREIYLPHPAHKEFGRMLGPHLDKVLVIDYWTR
ncbi:MAG: Dabb family protein [Phycisphaerales bacterium]